MFSLERSGFPIKIFISTKLFYHPCLGRSCPGPAAAPRGLPGTPGGLAPQACPSGALARHTGRALWAQTQALRPPLGRLSSRRADAERLGSGQGCTPHGSSREQDLGQHLLGASWAPLQIGRPGRSPRRQDARLSEATFTNKLRALLTPHAVVRLRRGYRPRPAAGTPRPREAQLLHGGTSTHAPRAAGRGLDEVGGVQRWRREDRLTGGPEPPARPGLPLPSVGHPVPHRPAPPCLVTSWLISPELDHEVQSSRALGSRPS